MLDQHHSGRSDKYLFREASCRRRSLISQCLNAEKQAYKLKNHVFKQRIKNQFLASNIDVDESHISVFHDKSSGFQVLPESVEIRRQMIIMVRKELHMALKETHGNLRWQHDSNKARQAYLG